VDVALTACPNSHPQPQDPQSPNQSPVATSPVATKLSIGLIISGLIFDGALVMALVGLGVMVMGVAKLPGDLTPPPNRFGFRTSAFGYERLQVGRMVDTANEAIASGLSKERAQMWQRIQERTLAVNLRGYNRPQVDGYLYELDRQLR
jgi:hypothetical protein